MCRARNRSRAASCNRVTSVVWMTIRPSSGVARPAITFSSVVFPPPLCPRMTTCSPEPSSNRGTFRIGSRSPFGSRYAFLTFSTSSMRRQIKRCMSGRIHKALQFKDLRPPRLVAVKTTTPAQRLRFSSTDTQAPVAQFASTIRPEALSTTTRGRFYMSILQSVPYRNGVIVPLIYAKPRRPNQLRHVAKITFGHLLFWHDLCFISRR